MARHYSELTCWQLARELRREIFRLTSKPTFRDDFRLRDQLRSAASRAAACIAEGFGRVTHADFARFLDMSRASVNEIENGLGEALERRYVEEAEIGTALNLIIRVRSAIGRLMRYLINTPTPSRASRERRSVPRRGPPQ